MSSTIDQLFPKTHSVEKTLAFIEQYLDKPTYNHVIRSALFSSLIAHKFETNSPEHSIAKVDVELVVISNLLHDLAWNPDLKTTKQFISQDKRFEVDGANAAREFLQTLNWDKHRIQLVWDAIALHTSPSIAWYKEPEVAVTQYGIATDVYYAPGLPFPGVTPDNGVSKNELDEIYRAYPSLQLAQYVKQALCALCMQKPETTFDNFVSGYGEEYVDEYTLQGKRLVDMMKAREAAESET